MSSESAKLMKYNYIKKLILIIIIGGSMCAFDVNEREVCSINKTGLDMFLIIWEKQAKSILLENKVEVNLVKREFVEKAATEEDILKAENNFDIRISTQISNFYKLTNGLNLIGVDGILTQFLFKISEVRAFNELSPNAVSEWIGEGANWTTDEMYYIYGDEQRPYTARLDYLRTAIALSRETANSTILINREIKFESGEWEIWNLSTYLNGAVRFNSFNAFLEFECRSHLQDLTAYFENV